MLLIKTDKEGNEQWHKTFGGVDYEYGVSMTMNNEGDLYLFGSTKSFGQNGSVDYYLVKTDDDGTELWTLTIGGDDADFGNSIIADEDNGCTVIGQSKSYGEGNFDMFIAKVNKNGIIEDLINGTDSVTDDTFTIFPNPVSINGKVRINDNATQNDLIMELFSINGLPVKLYTLKQPGYHFNAETLPAGTYIYRIHSSDNSGILFSGKLIVR